jgi:hypothetical protein
MPFYIWALVLAGAVGIPAVACVALYRGALAAGRPATRVAVIAAVWWVAWLAITWVLAATNLLKQDAQVVRPWFTMGFLVATLIPLGATRIPVVSAILADPGTPRRFAWPHAVRVVGVFFLLALALGKVPAVFAIPAGIGDILVGISAPFAARRLAAGDRVGAVWFNVMGIVDLVVAMTIGFLCGPGPTQVLHVTPSTQAISVLPLVLIPVTAVPLMLALHIVSLVRLSADREQVESQRRQAVAA